METTTSEVLSETLEQLNERYAFAFIPLIVIWSIMVVVGVTGNLTVLLVFSQSKEYKFNNYKVFVIFVASLDLSACCTVIPFELLNTHAYLYYSSIIPCKMRCFLNTFFIISAASACLAICADRFRKVCQPMKKQMNPTLTVKITIFVLVFALFVSIPASIACHIKSENITDVLNTTTITGRCNAERKVNQDNTFRDIYRLGMTAFLIGVSISLIVMYVLIGREVLRHAKFVQSLGQLNISSNKNSPGLESKEADSLGQDCIDAEQERETQLNSQELRKSSINMRTGKTKNIGHKAMDQPTREPTRMADREQQERNSRKGLYKTYIWLVATIIFIVNIFLNVIALYVVVYKYRVLEHWNQMSAGMLVGLRFLNRSYYFNHIMNPFIYAWLDRRFLPAFKNLLQQAISTIMCLN